MSLTIRLCNSSASCSPGATMVRKTMPHKLFVSCRTAVMTAAHCNTGVSGSMFQGTHWCFPCEAQSAMRQTLSLRQAVARRHRGLITACCSWQQGFLWGGRSQTMHRTEESLRVLQRAQAVPIPMCQLHFTSEAQGQALSNSGASNQ